MRAAQLLTQLARPGDHRRLLVIEGASLPPLVVEQITDEGFSVPTSDSKSMSWQPRPS